METLQVQIVKIISEHKKKNRANPEKHIFPVAPGCRRVMAIVKYPGSKKTVTRHCDTRDGKVGFIRIEKGL